MFGDTMGNIGFIFGYGIFGAFCIGVLVGYVLKWFGDRKDGTV